MFAGPAPLFASFAASLPETSAIVRTIPVTPSVRHPHGESNNNDTQKVSQKDGVGESMLP